MRNLFTRLAYALTALLMPAAAMAENVGIAKPGQLYFQPPATPVMERLEHLHDFLLIIITLVTLFVLGLIIYVVVRFNEKANPVPSKTTHNTKLEIIWTTIPVLILIAIAIPSLKLHYFMATVEESDLTLKVIGRQWYWEYEYPDSGVTFESRMVQEKDLKPGQPRLLTVDNEVVVPVNTNVRVQITAGDVIHSFAMPAFGIKTDAMPGRLNETWFKAEKTGTYYGQCSELCGVDHGFMPIVIRVVEKEEFDAWTASKKTADAGSAPRSLASVQQ